MLYIIIIYIGYCHIPYIIMFVILHTYYVRIIVYNTV